ncbi:MAG: AIPR family protein, partial [Mycoplasmataceae bacterium]|nr:AIPR family protein [Mycoplasmataceae bacterium]
SAKSIKNLWKEYENKLLGMNLRLHIKNKNVDEEIKKSIEDNDGLFWFKNNGLVIICSDIKFLKNKIELKNFSIINGGQTTFSIGNSNFDKDFFLTCKIIVIKGLQDEDGVDEKEYEKIHEISTTISLSTNNQKPIKKTDKISSISNCRILKQDLWNEKEEVFLEIRRGDKPFKKIKAWQKIKAETLQQIYYAFFKLLPGKARIKQDSLFKVENLKSSFEDMRKMSFSLIIDLIKFWFILNENSKNKNFSKITIEHIQNETELKLYQKQFVTYFKFYSISALFILVLMYKNENFKIWIKDKKSYFQEEYVQPKEKRKKDWIFEILDYWNKTNIERIFKFKDLEKIKSKWNGFIHKNMNIIFFKNIKDKEGNEILSWTNFTKTDINFLPILINIIDNYDVIEDELGSLF